VVLKFTLEQLNVYLPKLTDSHNRDSTYGVVTRLRVERRRIRDSTAEKGKRENDPSVRPDRLWGFT